MHEHQIPANTSKSSKIIAIKPSCLSPAIPHSLIELSLIAKYMYGSASTLTVRYDSNFKL